METTKTQSTEAAVS